MKVVLINETHAPRMGYLGSMLPKFLARLGLEVHVLATDLPAYHNFGEFKSGVPRFLEEQTLAAGTVANVDGYSVHILGHRRILGRVYMRGMAATLAAIRPDVVYSVLAIGWLPLQAMMLKLRYGYKLFTGSHTTALMFPLARSSKKIVARAVVLLTRALPGRIVSIFSEVCYCPTADCGEVAHRFFGVQKRKIKIVHLGVDSDYFHPVRTSEELSRRSAFRNQLGFDPRDIVCIYTGKMVRMKNPLLLAQAIRRLRSEGLPFRGLFIGDGAQRAEIEGFEECVVLDFMLFSELADYYRASDIGVWLTNESTSMLDAAACGLPIVVSDRIYRDHVDGNGCTYLMNNLDSLCDTLKLLVDEGTRRRLGEDGAAKMAARFSWARAAKVRFDDFTRATDGGASPSGSG